MKWLYDRAAGTKDTRATLQDVYDAIWLNGFWKGIVVALAAVGAVWLLH